ncbi:C6 zinc finger domain protein [Seiridium cupressi]
MRTASKVTKAKVKSGCRTCKVRKVKCDEGRPSCQRCISTGRVCDGYGIWGGGGNRLQDRRLLRRNCSPPTELQTRAPLGITSPKQQRCFEWFVFRTAPKIPSAFFSGFWDTLVFQASSSEAAVFHATLALSSAHQTNPSIGRRSASSKLLVRDEDESFMLQQYSNAISHLQTHFSSGTRASVRVTLITCLLFICLELLRGRYRSAIHHLESGLKLLRDFDAGKAPENIGNLMYHSQPFADYWITETFSRLHVSTAMFGQISPHLYPASSGIELLPRTFCSSDQARHSLDHITARAIDLALRASKVNIAIHPKNFALLADVQRQLRSDRSCWIELYIRSKAYIDSKKSFLGSWAYEMLELYYTVAMIMIETSLDSNNESIYDAYTEQFVSIVEHSISNFKSALSSDFQKHVPGHNTDMSKSICDIVSHSEGVWNATTATCVAEEIMSIEEADFFEHFVLDDDFYAVTLPVEFDRSLPPLPLSHRLRHVKVTLPNNSPANVAIDCQRVREDGEVELLRREYDASTGRWKVR